MKLFIINTGYGMTPEEIAVRVNRMKNVAAPDTVILMECMEHTNICIDSQLDIALAAPEIIAKAIKAEKEGFDAIGIYCTSDPGLRACREAVHIPVIGGGMASFLTAAALGYRYSMITTSKNRVSEKYEFARECGLDPVRLASIRSIEYDILEENKHPNREAVLHALIEEGRKCRDEDKADVIIMGCLSFAGMGAEIEKELKIPVVDPAFAMVGMAEGLYRQKLSHSKKAYPVPPLRERSWGSGTIL